LCIDKLNFTIQSRNMTGQFTTHVTISFVIGLIMAFPYAFWEIWRFVKPGLYTKERNLTSGAVFYVSLLFMLGVLFGYYILSPLSINFLANYTVDESIINEFDLLSYIETLVMMVLACALMFQLPMVVYVLSKTGLVTPQLMRMFRRHAIIVILFVAAVLTPSPDMFSQLIVAVPIYLLYEISIYISAAVEKARLIKYQ
jgi:sec-independent protein translocase protein TatC